MHWIAVDAFGELDIIPSAKDHRCDSEGREGMRRGLFSGTGTLWLEG